MGFYATFPWPSRAVSAETHWLYRISKELLADSVMNSQWLLMYCLKRMMCQKFTFASLVVEYIARFQARGSKELYLNFLP